MKNERYLDAGAKMTYCPKHMYWRKTEEQCEGCANEAITKSVEIKNGC